MTLKIFHGKNFYPHINAISHIKGQVFDKEIVSHE